MPKKEVRAVSGALLAATRGILFDLFGSAEFEEVLRKSQMGSLRNARGHTECFPGAVNTTSHVYWASIEPIVRKTIGAERILSKDGNELLHCTAADTETAVVEIRSQSIFKSS